VPSEEKDAEEERETERMKEVQKKKFNTVIL
jgi:hypothetical protein